MAFTAAFPILHSDDVGRLIAFYTGVLGLPVTYRFPGDGEPDFVTVGAGRNSIGLGRYADIEGALGGPVPRGGMPFQVCMYTDDLDTDLARLRAAQAPMLREPVIQPWGERVCYVTDPDGNLVMLTERLPS